jgi:HAD superfamily hydrolase (TIGR01509 family)
MTVALLWDHDGVLVDTEGLYFQATREMLAKVDVTLTSELYRQYLLVEGTGAWHLAEQRGVSPSEIQALRAQRNLRYAQLLAQGDVLVPGVLPVLASLARRYRMAIVTSSQRDHFATIHRATGLPQHFELVLTRGDYVHSKPAPEPYLTALTRMQLRAEQCLVIEDSERGLRAACAAGLRCWVVPSQLTQGSSFSGAERTFANLAELCEALLIEARR